ncbi:MAG: glycosyltransferase family 39 protein [Ardenticatenaceae bacterium]|nr:glycosyltransferase family 39 protein [Ardenticatenaceae bacterium]
MIFLLAFTLLLAALIFTDAWPGLRGPAPDTAEWHWIYRLRPFSRWWLPLIVAASMVGLAAWWLQTKRLLLGLAALVVGNLLLQGALVYAEKPAVLTELIERSLADETNGYFRLAAETDDLNSLLRSYPNLMPNFPSEHTRTHPPGLILANWLVIQEFARWPSLSQNIAERIWPLRCTDLWLLDSPPAVAAALATVTLLTVLAGALTIIPTYALARRLLPEKSARLATAFVATLPSLVIFTPTPVQADALLATTALWCLHEGIHKKVNGWVFIYLSGLLLSATTFSSLSNGALVLLFTGYAAWHWWAKRQERPFSHLFTQLVWLGLGSATVWLVYWAGWGVPPWAVAQEGLAQHYELVTLHRRYDWWLVYNWLDVLIFAGPAIVAGFLLLFRQPRTLLRQPLAALIVPLAGLLLLLDISGSARGEVGRLWLFLMPFLAIGSAAYFGKLAGFTRASAPLLAVIAQLMVVVAIGLAWRPIEAIIVVAELPSLPTNPVPENEVDVTFLAAAGPLLTLRGYDLIQTAESLDVTLYWQAEQTAVRPYTVFTHLLNAQGELVAQQDNWPVNGRWPPTCWQTSDLITDPYQLSLAGLAPGTYTLTVGWYDARDNTRLTLPSGEDALRLATIER